MTSLWLLASETRPEVGTDKAGQETAKCGETPNTEPPLGLLPSARAIVTPRLELGTTRCGIWSLGGLGAGYIAGFGIGSDRAS